MSCKVANSSARLRPRINVYQGKGVMDLGENAAPQYVIVVRSVVTEGLRPGTSAYYATGFLESHLIFMISGLASVITPLVLEISRDISLPHNRF